MKTMTASEVSRNFASVLDRVADGETVVITRGGKRLAIMEPTPNAAGRAVKDALAPLVGTLDDDFGRDIAAATELLTLDDTWRE